MAQHSNQKQRGIGMEESISALVDGEVSEMELHRVLKATETDAAVRQTWSRYQLISATMRSDVPAMAPIDLSAAIRDALDAEEPLQVSQPARRTGWWGGFSSNFAKVGVAASVAAVMVVTAQMVSLGGDPAAVPALAGNEPVAATSAPGVMTPNPTLPAGFQAPSLNARTVSTHPQIPVQQAEPHYYPLVKRAPNAYANEAPAPEVQAYLQRVMEIHASHAALNSNQGMLPYARVPADTNE